MRYLGGKSRIAKQLAAVIDQVRPPGSWIWEPFCGGLSMTVALSKNGPVWATDANPALIALYQAVRDGWDPPTEVTAEIRDAALSLPDSDPHKAFYRIGCGFGANWSSGLWRSPGRNPALEARSSLKRDVPAVRGPFAAACFLAVPPRPTAFAGIYADPPYRGTTQYRGAPPFDADAFVHRCICWSRFVDVWVSEYAFPIGRCVWEKSHAVTFGSNHAGKRATERLYYIAKGSLP